LIDNAGNITSTSTKNIKSNIKIKSNDNKNYYDSLMKVEICTYTFTD